jgi:hypothetical protein
MLSKNTQLESLNTGFKESIFLMGVLGWASIGILLNNIAKSSGKKNLGNQLLFSFSGLSALVGTFYLGLDLQSPIPRFLYCFGIVMLVVAIDFERKQFYQNITIHLNNSAFVGIAFYFVCMQLYPDSFGVVGGLWERILPSVPTAFNMLILCLICLNIGYYFVYPILFAFLALKKSWFFSVRNSFNLLFIRKSSDELFLFITFSLLGLITRIWNFTLGRFFAAGGGAAESQSIPGLISSFLAQFDSLYTIAWLYGIILMFQQDFKKNEGQKLIGGITVFLVIIELVYQVISGSKGRFATSVIIPLAFAYYFARRKVSWAIFLGFGMVGLTSLFFVYPLLVIYRGEISAVTYAPDPVVLMGKAWNTLQSLSWDQYQQTVLIPFNSSGITEQVIAMTSIVHFVDRLPLPPEYLWERLLWFWLPRFLSPGKLPTFPANAIGRLTERVGASDFTTSVLQTGPGELFIYYQLFGCLMMIIPGILFRWFNESASPFRLYSHFRMAIFITYLPLMFGILGGGFEAGVTGMMLQLGVLIVALEFVRSST